MKNLHLEMKRKLLILFILPVYLLSLVIPAGNYVKAAELPIFTIAKEDHFQVGPGVNHSSYSLVNENHVEAVNTMEIDPKNPSIDLVVTSPKGKVVALDTVRNQAKQIDQEGQKVIGAFNGDFYNTDPKFAGVPNGLQITNGKIITAPQTSRSVLAAMEDGSFTMKEQVQMTGQVQISGLNDAKTITGINRPQNTSLTNSLYVYTSKFSETTRTSVSGIEVVLDPVNLVLKDNQLNKAKVESMNEASNSIIPAGKWVLSATGTNADWLRSNLTIGKEVTLDVNLNQGISNASNAVSGGTVLVREGQATPEALQDNVDRHPRTFISAKQGKLYVTTFDGRQPTYSDGVTIAEGAKYLAEQGMEMSINMDGGGSTTYGIRMPGDSSISVLNSPSDGYERANSNSLLVVSKAPVSELANLVPYPRGKVKILAGSKLSFTVKGQDQYLNGISINPDTLKWKSDNIGTVNESGQFTAAEIPGLGSITVSSSSISTTIPVEVVNSVSSLSINPNPAIINPGQKLQFQVKAFDEIGTEIYISNNQLKWATTGNIGTLSANGELTATNGSEIGSVSVSYGNVKAEVPVSIGKPPVVLEDFEDISDLTSSSARANSVKLDLMSRSNPVREGTHSARLSYDFTNTIGTSAAYVNFKGNDGSIGRLLEDRPSKLGLWVYGDGKNHWLRSVIQDGNGKNITLNLTEAGQLNWVGWKYVSANIPADTVTPIKLRQVYVVETSNSNKNKGAVYFDHLRAIYSDTGEDLAGPVFSNALPENKKKIYTNTPVISAVVKDEGKGVDSGSIIMTVDGKSVPYQYNHETGLISYKPAQPLKEGEHHVEIDAIDLAGNPALPKADWTFTVYTGEDVEAPVIQVISPADGITTRTNRPRIAAKLFDDYKGIDTSNTTLIVDGKEENFQIDQASSTVYFTPSSELSENSSHTVRIIAKDNSGNETMKEWTFHVGTPLGQPNDSNRFQMSVIGDGGYYTAGQGQTAADILLREQITRINQEPSELVAYTGDIVENDTPANFQTGLKNMNLFKMPYIVSIGNHEISGTNSRENYQKAFGEPTYSYQYGNSRMIGIDSANGGITNSDASQWPWLQETLNDTKENNIFIFMHVPPDEISASGEDFNTGHGFSSSIEAKRFYDLMGAFKQTHPEKNIIVLSGDLHAYQHKTVQGVDYIISGGGGKYTHIPADKGGFYHYLNLIIENNTVRWDVVPLLDRIEPQQSEVELTLSEQTTLNATGHFLTSSNQPISLPIAAPFKMNWTSSDEKIATVDSNGVVTAIAPGKASIRLQSGWKEAEFTITVPPSPALEAVEKVEMLTESDLKTQDAIDSANTDIQNAETLVSALRDGNVKTELLARLQVVKEKVTVAQKELYYQNAVLAVDEAEKMKTSEAVEKADNALALVENDVQKEELVTRLQEVKRFVKANTFVDQIMANPLQTKEDINKALSDRSLLLSIMDSMSNEQNKDSISQKLIQADPKIKEGIQFVLNQKQQGKPEPISDTWLTFLVDYTLQQFAPYNESKFGDIQGSIMKIVKEHATGKRVKEKIEERLQFMN